VAKKKPLPGGPASFYKGRPYTKAGLGIRDSRQASHIIKGRWCIFLNMNDQQFKNKEEKDGIVYESRTDADLVDEGYRQETLVSIFTREKPRTPFIYRGDAKIAIRYSETQNKLLWK
jgi:hypothetical protein